MPFCRPGHCPQTRPRARRGRGRHDARGQSGAPTTATQREGGSQWTGRATRRHPGWPLSTRRRAGLLHPSRPCPPRDHPPNVSIGPYLVVRPEADLALVLGDSSIRLSDRPRAPSFPVLGCRDHTRRPPTLQGLCRWRRYWATLLRPISFLGRQRRSAHPLLTCRSPPWQDRPGIGGHCSPMTGGAGRDMTQRRFIGVLATALTDFPIPGDP